MKGCSLGQILAADATVMSHLAEDELHELLDPAKYLGSTDEMISSVLSAYAGQTKEEG